VRVCVCMCVAQELDTLDDQLSTYHYGQKAM
jgi:hypothetical protein